MKNELKEKAQKFFGQIKNTKELIIIFIVGIVLLIMPSAESNKEKEAPQKNNDSTYQEQTEEDLKSILSKIKGAGKVDVMITFEDGGNTYYAKDENTDYSENEQQKTKSSENTHVFSKETSSKETPLITRRTYPKISGILVCASGAGNPGVKNNIINATQALLGIKSHRIEVLERK